MRSQSFLQTAFKNLPAWCHFQAMKAQESNAGSMLTMRKVFTAQLEDLHRRTLARHSALVTPEQEEQAWDLWRQQQAA